MGNERQLTVLALLLTLFPEGDFTEEKAYVTCVLYLSSRNRCKYIAVPASTLLGRQLFDQIVYQITSTFVVCQGHLFHIPDGV